MEDNDSKVVVDRTEEVLENIRRYSKERLSDLLKLLFLTSIAEDEQNTLSEARECLEQLRDFEKTLLKEVDSRLKTIRSMKEDKGESNVDVNSESH